MLPLAGESFASVVDVGIVGICLSNFGHPWRMLWYTTGLLIYLRAVVIHYGVACQGLAFMMGSLLRG